MKLRFFLEPEHGEFGRDGVAVGGAVEFDEAVEFGGSVENLVGAEAQIFGEAGGDPGELQILLSGECVVEDLLPAGYAFSVDSLFEHGAGKGETCDIDPWSSVGPGRVGRRGGEGPVHRNASLREEHTGQIFGYAEVI